MLVTSDVILLINYSIYAATLTHLGCMGALFWFRYKEPKRPRPFKVSQRNTLPEPCPVDACTAHRCEA